MAELRHAMASTGLAVLQAEPGAGKTTVVPLRLLNEPWLEQNRILVLEPRRIAARAAAARMSALLDQAVGETVGYRTRGDTKVSATTRIEVVTEGILTRRLQRDPGLEGVGAIIFDEFHERSLNSDLGLALALEARELLREDLRVLVMSATINAEAVAALLASTTDEDQAPIISAAGRTHPVEISYRPRHSRDRVESAAAAATLVALDETEGDVLVFLPGIGEIRRTAQELERLPVPDRVKVHVLHGSLSAKYQDAAVAAAGQGRRKVVLSTDLAETSLTVDGVTAVVDCGLSRQPRFDPGNGMTRLVTVTASQASADQRAGRAGRVRPGRAYRLWAQSEHPTRQRHSPAEITQVDLAGFALELAAWGTNDPLSLPLLDQPPVHAWAEARRLLQLLGAVDGDGRITDIGRAMAALPTHPRLARILVESAGGAESSLACTLAAVLEERDVFVGPPHERPTSLAERISVVASARTNRSGVDPGAVATVGRRAKDLQRRVARGRRMPPDPDADADLIHQLGPLLLVGYPDRLARARASGSNRWRLRTGGGVSAKPDDPLCAAQFVVVCDTDGDRTDAAIRIATPIDSHQILAALADQVTEQRQLTWDRRRNDLTERRERMLDALTLEMVEQRPSPGPQTAAALVDRVREVGASVGLARWPEADWLRSRMEFVRRHNGGAAEWPGHDGGAAEWPDWSEARLNETLDRWLAPVLLDATGRRDLDRVDVAAVLAGPLAWDVRTRLDRLAPQKVTVPSGRSVPIDYSADPPILAVGLAEMFGSNRTPAVLDGALPLRVELRNPAGRPVQITSDLAGFWAGSWAQVRGELRGRYPKHDWPEDPATASPRRR